MNNSIASGKEAGWVYGRQVVLEILKSPKTARKLLIAEGFPEKNIQEIIYRAEQKRISIERVSRKVLDSLFPGNHQGVALQSERVCAVDLKSFLNLSAEGINRFVALLDEIQDPQNLGAIVRSAVCFGCSAAIISKWRSAGITEGVMRSSSGAAAHLPLIQISSLTVAIERLKEKRFFIYGADPEGTSLPCVQLEFPLAIMFGNEHRGIKPILKKACDRLVSIPQEKTIASLNVSAAAAIFFYEISKRMVRLGSP